MGVGWGGRGEGASVRIGFEPPTSRSRVSRVILGYTNLLGWVQIRFTSLSSEVVLSGLHLETAFLSWRKTKISVIDTHLNAVIGLIMTSIAVGIGSHFSPRHDFQRDNSV